MATPSSSVHGFAACLHWGERFPSSILGNWAQLRCMSGFWVSGECWWLLWNAVLVHVSKAGTGRGMFTFSFLGTLITVSSHSYVQVRGWMQHAPSFLGFKIQDTISLSICILVNECLFLFWNWEAMPLHVCISNLFHCLFSGQSCNPFPRCWIS